jgi:hypothetical protein
VFAGGLEFTTGAREFLTMPRPANNKINKNKINEKILTIAPPVSLQQNWPPQTVSAF